MNIQQVQGKAMKDRTSASQLSLSANYKNQSVRYLEREYFWQEY